MENNNINQEYKNRINKVKELSEKGIQSWPLYEEITINAKEAKLLKQEDYEKRYNFAGRIVGKREHGKTIFITIEDSTDKIQAYIKNEEGSLNNFELITKFFDVGDYVYFSGTLFITKMGELTIRILDAKILSKCLHPIPDFHVGFKDIETRYRHRTIDLLVNKNVKETFIKRSLIIKEIRDFLNKNDYLEVETPMLHPIPGGAAARPFITHHNALDIDLYMRIAPELYLKRLVVGGLEKVYEINRNFRNEGVSVRHNPEFTMLEFYTAHKDYLWAMDFIEKLMQTVLMKINGKLNVEFNGMNIDFSKKFERISAYNAILKYTDIKEDQLSKENIDKTLTDYGLGFSDETYNKKIFILFEELAEKKLVQPTFLIDFPIEISPLSKRDKDRPDLASRFEMFIAGMEVCNGFSELNDPFEQAERFREQVANKEKGDQEAMHFDKDYITALEYGLPPTVGVGIGIDRFVMLATGERCIKDVILFPTMRPELDQEN